MKVSLQLPKSLFKFIRNDGTSISAKELDRHPVILSLNYEQSVEYIYFRHIFLAQKSIEKLFFMNQGRQLGKVIDAIPPGSDVLMIGPGRGFGSFYLQKTGYQVSNIDVVDTIHPQLRHMISTQVYDGSVLPYEDQAFDAVIAMYVLHHIGTQDDILPFLQEMKRVSKRLIIIDESWDTPRQKLQLFSYDLWYNLLGNGNFSVDTTAYLKTGELSEMLDKIGCQTQIYEEDMSPWGKYNLVYAVSYS